MFKKRKRNPQQQNSDFMPDCNHSKEYHDIVEREVEDCKVMAFQCKMCDTFGRRPVAFIFREDGGAPTPDFDTLKRDTETQLYYKLNYLSQIFPNRKVRILIAKTKHELKTRYQALKYDNPEEGTRKHWKRCEEIRQELLER